MNLRKHMKKKSILPKYRTRYTNRKRLCEKIIDAYDNVGQIPEANDEMKERFYKQFTVDEKYPKGKTTDMKSDIQDTTIKFIYGKYKEMAGVYKRVLKNKKALLFSSSHRLENEYLERVLEELPVLNSREIPFNGGFVVISGSVIRGRMVSEEFDGDKYIPVTPEMLYQQIIKGF